jgi:hypothetical protein
MDTWDGTGDESPFAAAVKGGRFPFGAVIEALEEVAGAHQQQHALLRAAIDVAKDVHRPRLAEALRGQAGDAQLAAFAANTRMWDQHADLYPPAAAGVTNAVGELRNLQSDLNLLIQEKESKYNEAVRRGDVVAAQQILADAHTEADRMVTDRGGNARGYIQAVNFTAPIPQGPGTNSNDPSTSDGGTKPPGQKHHKKTDPTTGEAAADDGDTTHELRTEESGSPAPDGTNPPHDGRTDIPPVPLQQNGGQRLPTGMPFGDGGLGSGTGGGGLTSGLGSGLRPPSPALGSVAGAGAGTSPASVMPQAPSAPSALSHASASPLANAGSSFQSGLACGIGASGGAGPVTPLPPQPVQPLASQQPTVAAPTAGTGAGGVPAAGGFAAPADAGSHGGVGSGAATGAGGGTSMMPPPAGLAAAQPLAPYSAPGAGAAGGGGSGAPTAQTASAGGGGSGQSASAGGAGSAAGGAGAPAVMAGNPGSSAVMSALAGSSADVNPDLLTAQRVLAGLVRGSEDSGLLVVWAVAVLKMPEGSQIVVANNMGGGRYLPATVYLPASAKLAVSDPALPMGWAEDWWGCLFPSKILVEYFERLRKVVAGVSISALMTTELWAKAPADWGGGDFVGMRHRDVLPLLSEAPKLDAAHQHRLATIDPVLARRVKALDQGGEVSVMAAATLTNALYAPAKHGDDSQLPPLVSDAEDQILAAVNNGTASADTWAKYEAAVRNRDEAHNGAVTWPESHAPRDNDGSDVARASIRLYRHYFRMGRMIELVQCWKGMPASPPRLAEVAYCGILAGFDTAVANTIAAMEQQQRLRKA